MLRVALLIALAGLAFQDPPESPQAAAARKALADLAGSPVADRRGALRDLEGKISAQLAERIDDLDLRDVRLRIREELNDAAGARLDTLYLSAHRPSHAPYLLRRADLARAEGRYDEVRRLVAPHVKDHPAAAALDALARYALNDFDGIAQTLQDARPRLGSWPLGLASAVDFVSKSCREAPAQWKEELDLRAAEAAAKEPPPVVALSTAKGDIELTLFEDAYPNTVANFITLLETGFYRGLRFHRHIPDFMIQGGCPVGTGTGGPGYRLKDELGPVFRRHFRGSVAMARSADPNSGGSQFYFAHRPLPWCDGKYIVFGFVSKGMDVVDALRRGDTIRGGRVIRKRAHAYRVERQ